MLTSAGPARENPHLLDTMPQCGSCRAEGMYILEKYDRQCVDMFGYVHYYGEARFVMAPCKHCPKGRALEEAWKGADGY